MKAPKLRLLLNIPIAISQPMTESDATRLCLIYCVEALRLFFRGRSQVYVSGSLFIYYQEGQPNKSVSPDVFVVFGDCLIFFLFSLKWVFNPPIAPSHP